MTAKFKIFHKMPRGKNHIFSFLLGFTHIFDGLIRIITLGSVFGNLTAYCAFQKVKRDMEKTREKI